MSQPSSPKDAADDNIDKIVADGKSRAEQLMAKAMQKQMDVKLREMREKAELSKAAAAGVEAASKKPP